MPDDPAPRPRGRAREAERNDARIFQVAIDMLARDAHASVAAIGREAGVGKSALYSRYPAREVLLAAVAEEVTRRYLVILDHAHDALRSGAPAAEVLRRFLLDLVEAGFLGFLVATNGRFTPTDIDVRLSKIAYDLGVRLVAQLQEAGALRSDATYPDLNDWAQAIASVGSEHADRVAMRRERMLSALLQGLAPTGAALAGSPPIATDYWPSDRDGFVDRPDVWGVPARGARRS